MRNRIWSTPPSVVATNWPLSTVLIWLPLSTTTTSAYPRTRLPTSTRMRYSFDGSSEEPFVFHDVPHHWALRSTFTALPLKLATVAPHVVPASSQIATTGDCDGSN